MMLINFKILKSLIHGKWAFTKNIRNFARVSQISRKFSEGVTFSMDWIFWQFFCQDIGSYKELH